LGKGLITEAESANLSATIEMVSNGFVIYLGNRYEPEYVCNDIEAALHYVKEYFFNSTTQLNGENVNEPIK